MVVTVNDRSFEGGGLGAVSGAGYCARGVGPVVQIVSVGYNSIGFFISVSYFTFIMEELYIYIDDQTSWCILLFASQSPSPFAWYVGISWEGKGFLTWGRIGCDRARLRSLA